MRGEGVREIGSRLKNEGLIKSATGFKLYSLLTGAAGRFRPGVYALSPAMSGYRIAKRLTEGSVLQVVVIEGATLVDIDHVLGEAGVLRKGELIEYNRHQGESLEGMLFPDTYRLEAGMTPENVARVMKANFDARTASFTAGRPKSVWYPELIIASLVEKEAMRERDRLVIAGIMRKRLVLGMPLQIDAALIYGKCKGAYSTCPSAVRELTKDDLLAPHPYNTYRYQGLPPTPIANPGSAALRAAQQPERSSYLYYISNPKNGNLVFAATLEEHNANRKKYHVN